MLLIRHFLMLLFVLFFCTNLNAKESKTIFSIVSDRSADTLNSGANTYLKNSDDKIIIRTVSQISLMSDIELDKHLKESDVVLLCAVFGDVVDRLLSKKYSSSQLRISLQGDRRLLILNNDLLTNPYTINIDKILEKDKENLGYINFLEKKQKEFPSYAFYLQARAYWDNRGNENIANLFSFLLNQTFQKNSWPKVVELKPIRYFLNANDSKTYFEIDEDFNKIIQQRLKYFNNNFVNSIAKYSKNALTFVYF